MWPSGRQPGSLVRGMAVWLAGPSMVGSKLTGTSECISLYSLYLTAVTATVIRYA